ncbi:Glucanosyltransferase-domain-containing protein [Dendryphion nanum]|uniref:1,3-beta-glucanosyltransferase n=1 Tax=Dendryphion nanum TaxID=256645 RepID=A0A9P9D4H8_9PLEO|nr:Glucanosyltransferase-domain-containing protein [Dendryphion nanum]
MAFRHSAWLIFWSILWSHIHYAVAELDPIVVKGSYFFYRTNGTQFHVRGISYKDGLTQTASKSPVDTLANGAACKRDIPFLLQLRVNVVRVSNIDVSKDHKECLDAFADAGIYIMAEMRSPTQWMEPKPEWTRWDVPLFQQYISVAEQLSNFTNVLGFVLGDTGDRAENSPGLPFFKAAIRDIREHVKQKNMREVPIGWVLGSPFLALKTTEQLDYMTCEEPRVNFLAVGLREVDDNGCTRDLRINETTSIYKNTPVPAFLYDHGCVNRNATGDLRKFGQISRLYSQDVASVLSGGILQTYFRKAEFDDSFGLVNVNNGIIEPVPGFEALSSAMATANPTPSNSAEYNPLVTFASCPTSAPNSKWKTGSKLPPKPHPRLCSCMMESLKCVAKESAMRSVGHSQYQTMVSSLCTNPLSDDCIGIQRDGGLGEYGAFSVCNMTESWSWLANRHTLRSGDQSCNLNNTVSLRPAPPAPGPECSFLLQQAGLNGEKAVTATFTGSSATGSPSNASGGSSGSGNSGGSSSSLSAGAKAGIAIGALGGVALILGAMLIVLRRRKNALKQKTPISEAPSSSDDPSALPPVYYRYDISEAHGSDPGVKGVRHGTQELHSSWGPHMMGDNTFVAELPAGGGSKNASVTRLSPAEIDGEGAMRSKYGEGVVGNATTGSELSPVQVSPSEENGDLTTTRKEEK